MEKEAEGLINECETDDERGGRERERLCCVGCGFISNLSIEVLINNRS